MFSSLAGACYNGLGTPGARWPGRTRPAASTDVTNEESMHYHRGILTVLVSAALLAAAVMTALVWYYPSLPDPAEADRRDLIRWLVTRDLSRVPEATREVLAERLEEEFSGEIDWDAMAGELTDQQRQRLVENVGRLIGPWIRGKACRYAALSEAERPAYLDGLIDTLQQWRGLDGLAPDAGASGSAASGRSVLSLDRAHVLAEHAGPAEQRQVDEFVIALQTHWAARELARHIENAARQLFSRP